MHRHVKILMINLLKSFKIIYCLLLLHNNDSAFDLSNNLIFE